MKYTDAQILQWMGEVNCIDLYRNSTGKWSTRFILGDFATHREALEMAIDTTRRQLMSFADTTAPQVGDKVRLKTTRVATIVRVIDPLSGSVQVDPPKNKPKDTVVTTTVRAPIQKNPSHAPSYKWWESDRAK